MEALAKVKDQKKSDAKTSYVNLSRTLIGEEKERKNIWWEEYLVGLIKKLYKNIMS